MEHPPAPRADRTGPDVVVLLHGVGVGGSAFSAVAAEVGSSRRVVVPERRGYGRRADLAPATSLDELVDDVAGVVDALRDPDRRPPAVVGVSGGATLALALAMRSAAGTTGPLGPVVVHEPLLGPLAPELHEAVTTSHRRTVAADPGLAATYVAGLVGPATWASLTPAERDAVAHHTPTITTEIPLFLAFAPRRDDLASLRGLALTSSLGRWSPPARQEVHRLLVDLAGAVPVDVDDAGHLPQVDAPAAFAAVLRRVLGPPAPEAP